MSFEDKVFLTVSCPMLRVDDRRVVISGMKRKLSLGQALDFGRMVEENSANVQNGCLRNGLMVTMEFTVTGLRYDNFKIGSVEILGLCDIVKCQCDKNYDVEADTQNGRAQFCFDKLSTGKCMDPNVRATVGRVLFPQYYAPQKTK